MRLAKVGERAQRLAMGIPLKTVADAYGSLDLLPDEIRELARLSLQSEIDLGPYLLRRRA